jgi:UrcA family protein
MKTLIKTRSQFTKSIVVASFIALGCTVVGSQALAQEPSAGATSREHADHLAVPSSLVRYPVRFSDLDLSTMKDAKTLYLRIHYAAELVCESAATWGKKEGQACVNKAIDDAVSRANLPLLSQYHQLRTQGDRAGLVQLAKSE